MNRGITIAIIAGVAYLIFKEDVDSFIARIFQGGPSQNSISTGAVTGTPDNTPTVVIPVTVQLPDVNQPAPLDILFPAAPVQQPVISIPDLNSIVARQIAEQERLTLETLPVFSSASVVNSPNLDEPPPVTGRGGDPVIFDSGFDSFETVLEIF